MKMFNFYKPIRGKKLWAQLFAVVAILSSSLICFSAYIPYTINLKIGDVAPKTITAPRFIAFSSLSDQAKTKALVDQRISLLKPVYSVDEQINKSVQAEIVDCFTQIRSYVESLETGPLMPRRHSLCLSAQNRYLLSTKTPESIGSLEYITIQTSSKLLSQGFEQIDSKKLKFDIANEVAILQLKSSDTQLIQNIILKFIKPNLVLDESKTAALKQAQIKSIRPFTSSYKEGEPIVYEGESITQDHIDALKALNVYGRHINYSRFVGISIFITLLFVIIERFLFYFCPKIYPEISKGVLVFLNGFIVLVIARFLFRVDSIPYAGNLNFLIPIPLIAFNISLLLTANLAMLSGSIFAIIIALMMEGDLSLLVYLFVSNCAATFASYRIFKRSELMRAGYIVGAINIITIIGIGLYKEFLDPMWFISNGLIGFGNGLLSSMITLAILPYFESSFKISTSLSLLEHANLNHPLLKKLMLSAPGTYQHSLMVANLAEAAAEAINANSILSRIGAYFHDIGKMKRPSFFTENQFSGENPHDTITPRMSKSIIASHPKDGVELAEKYQLPDPVITFIKEHHGTSLVSFFYTQALQETQNNDVQEEEFRYPGPIPSSKESGIVMLADCCEAAVRSLSHPTMFKIEGLVDKIFQDKIIDNQLNNCGLSLKEIETIKKTFIHLFQSMYHNRIDYQKEIKQFENGH